MDLSLAFDLTPRTRTARQPPGACSIYNSKNVSAYAKAKKGERGEAKSQVNAGVGGLKLKKMKVLFLCQAE
jgi:hypothetical protein